MNIFTPVVPDAEQHQHFRLIAQSGLYEPEIEVLKNWADGFVDRDGKFIKEFQKTFNSSFWELYLFACFKELGFSVNLSHATPDFILNSSYGEFIAEATTSNQPEDFRPEWDKDLSMLDGITIDEMLRLSTLRLLQSITEKHKKYVSKYSQLNHVKNKPFILCVTPFDQPFFFLQDSLALVRVLYAYDQPLIIQDTQKNEIIIIGESRKYQVQKKPGVDISLGLFTNPNMSDISAVMFNNRATLCKVRAIAEGGKYPVIFSGSRAIESENETGVERFSLERAEYKETLLDGCQILLNPFAKHPLNTKIFEEREIAIHNYDIATDRYQLQIPNGFLYQRVCMPIYCGDYGEKAIETIKKYKNSTSGTKIYKDLPSEKWSEDQLIYIEGQIGPFSKNRMAHYRGWTILVSLDSIDEDWSALAVNKLCYSHPQFMVANEDQNNTAIGLSEWLPTKEDAYATIKSKIDSIFENNNGDI